MITQTHARTHAHTHALKWTLYWKAKQFDTFQRDTVVYNCIQEVSPLCVELNPSSAYSSEGDISPVSTVSNHFLDEINDPTVITSSKYTDPRPLIRNY